MPSVASIAAEAAFQARWRIRISYFLSLLLHGVILVSSAAWFYEPARFGISIDKNEYSQTASSTIQLEWKQIGQAKSVLHDHSLDSEQVAPTTPTSKTRSQTGSVGAVKKAYPNYASNPAPPYPAFARRRGWEGVVKILVHVDEKGRVKSSSIFKSSGYPLLDRVALKTVRKWRFHPAKMGNIPISSTVLVPVRFELD